MRKNESIQSIASNVIKYVKKHIYHSNTTADYYDGPIAERFETYSKINATRSHGKSGINYINYKSDFLRLDHDRDLKHFERSIEGTKANKAGNCAEASILALEYIFEHHPEVRAEIYMIDGEGGDHVVLVLNRPSNSEDSNPPADDVIDADPMTWGDAVICDPHYDKTFPAKEYQQHLLNFNPNDTSNTEEHFEIIDPLKHKLVPYDNLGTDFLKRFSEPAAILELKKFFVIKLVILKKLTDMLGEQLADIQKNLKVPGLSATALKELQNKADKLAKELKDPIAIVDQLTKNLDEKHYRFHWQLRERMLKELNKHHASFKQLVPDNDNGNPKDYDKNYRYMFGALALGIIGKRQELAKDFVDIAMPSEVVFRLFDQIEQYEYDESILIESTELTTLDLDSIENIADTYFQMSIFKMNLEMKQN